MLSARNVNGFPTRIRNWLLGPHRETIGRSSADREPNVYITTQLRVVIDKALSPYQPGSHTILYNSLVPTDANVRIARHSGNVNGVPTRRRMVSSRFASDYIGGQSRFSGHRIRFTCTGTSFFAMRQRDATVGAVATSQIRRKTSQTFAKPISQELKYFNFFEKRRDAMRMHATQSRITMENTRCLPRYRTEAL